MSAKKTRRKQGGRDSIATRYVGLPWPLLLSPAFKSLSSDAAWLLVQLHLQFRAAQGGYSHLILPYADVAYHFKHERFARAAAELERLGFIRILERGGLFKKPNIYALSGEWERISKGLVADTAAGRMVKRRHGPAREWPYTDDPRNAAFEWQPMKRRGEWRLKNMAEAAKKKRKPRTYTPPAPRPPSLPKAAVLVIHRRLKAGESPAELAAEIRAQGFAVPGGLERERAN